MVKKKRLNELNLCVFFPKKNTITLLKFIQPVLQRKKKSLKRFIWQTPWCLSLLFLFFFFAGEGERLFFFHFSRYFNCVKFQFLFESGDILSIYMYDTLFGLFPCTITPSILHKWMNKNCQGMSYYCQYLMTFLSHLVYLVLNCCFVECATLQILSFWNQDKHQCS